MPLALLVTFVGVSLSALLSSMVINQIQTTHHSADKVQAISAAQAGLDKALGQIRGAFDAAGGDRHLLPCGPFTAPVAPSGSTDAAWYEVTIDYYLADPSGLQDKLATIAASRVNCTGSGAAAVPAYALLRARGTGAGDKDHNGVLDTDAGPWRSLYATYTFSTKDENIPGGPIKLVGTSYCLGSNSATPAAGMAVTIVPCTPASIRNTWIYGKHLTLMLARTRTAALPGGLCAQADSQTDGEQVMLRACAVATDFRQQWRYSTGPFAYLGTPDGKVDSAFCFHVEPAGALNAAVVMRTDASCTDGSWDSGHSFIPDPKAGAGAAGADTGQLVNHAEVGRCLDVPRDDVTGALAFGAKKPALITFPCKQAFSGAVHWNHLFAMPDLPPGEFSVTGHISVTPTYKPPEDPDPEDGIEQCVQSPGSAGGNVWVEPCTSSATFDWTIYTQAPLVRQAYQITDKHGNCLQAVGPNAPASQKLDAWSFVVTAKCDGSDLQKWNVPASFANGPLKDLGEN
jgi:hypothetical protein